MMRRKSRQAGFSLIELLVTALIFGIGLLGLAALQVSTMRSNSGGRSRFTATALAEGCMSAIQSEGSLTWTYSAGVLGSSAVYAGTRTYTGGAATGTFGAFDINGLPVPVNDPAQVFLVTWAKLDPTDATPKANITGMNLREFRVTVSWIDQKNDAQGAAITNLPTLSLSRLIRYGV